MKTNVKTTHPLIAKAQREIEEEELKIRQANAEKAVETAATVLKIVDIISGL